MKKRTMAYIYALILAACISAADAPPASAAEMPGEPIPGDTQALEENFSDRNIPSNGSDETSFDGNAAYSGNDETFSDENIADSDNDDAAFNGNTAYNDNTDASSIENAADSDNDNTSHKNAADSDNDGTASHENAADSDNDGTASHENAADSDNAETPGENETNPEPELPDDGLIRVDGALYSGDYMDSSGVFYLVTEGVTKPFYGIVNAGTAYYNCDTAGLMTPMTLPKQTMFIAGKAYTGYYMDNSGILYAVTAGTTAPANGAISKGTPYFSYNDAGAMISMCLPGQTVFVNGKAYTGYYMDSSGMLYTVSEGTAAPVNGALAKGTPYYSYDAARTMALMKLPGQTVFVDGNVYSGYYRNAAGKMYHVKKGTPAPKTGILKKGTKYYNDPSKKTKTLSKQTLYVNGKAYTGYYMNSKHKMYHVKKGTLTLKTGALKKGTKYFNYPSKKTKTLSKQTLYVNGKAYTGYYMNTKHKMYHVKKGTSAPKTGILKKGTKYFSYASKKTKKLSKETLYVNGKAYTGYYLDNKNKMYRANKGTLALATGMIGQGAQYYSYKEKKTQTMPQETLYVDGSVYNGYYLGSDNKMYFLSNGTYTPVNTALGAGTAYYSCVENRMAALPAAKAYVDGKAVESLTPAGVETFQKAQAVVQAITAPTDSPADKLYKCYLWIEKCPYVQYRTMAEGLNISPDDWDVIFANDIFDANSGCCVSLSCAFAYMAKACGFERVTICSDTKHAWVDIDGRLYDPLFAKDRDFSKNYNAAYTDYRVHAAITREL